VTLWTSDEAAQATGGSTGQWTATGVSIDTRTLEPGDLFVALQAARDGHDFVAQAMDKGAAAALVSRVPEGVDASKCLLVSDVQSGLEALGRFARARTEARVVAVTGSVGKTSTKEMLRAALAGQGATHASVASYNNHWGVPLTLARMPADTKLAVIEIGMNHPGEIAPLARMARPHVALVTTVGLAHLEAFGSIAGIAAEKASIFEGLEKGGTAVFNGDLDPDLLTILDNAAGVGGGPRIRFGANQGCHYCLSNVRTLPDCTVAEATTHGAPGFDNGTNLLLKVRSPGVHFAANGLGAFAAAMALGADPAQTLIGLGNWSPPAGRGAREVIALDPVETDMTLELIDDAYNANPTSVAASLEVLAAAEVHHDVGRVSKGRRIAFLGDMKELGPTGPADHAALAQLRAMDRVDRVHCIGPLMANLHAALPEAQKGEWVETTAELVPRLRHLLDSGDVVLAKGSLSMGLTGIVEGIRKLGRATPDANSGTDEE